LSKSSQIFIKSLRKKAEKQHNNYIKIILNLNVFSIFREILLTKNDISDTIVLFQKI